MHNPGKKHVPGPRTGMRVVTQCQTDLWQRCQALEYKVFLDSGFITPTPDKRLIEYDRYTPTRFLALVDRDPAKGDDTREIFGVARVISAPGKSHMKQGLFPTIDKDKELNLYPEKIERLKAMDPGTCFDIATMSIPADYRNGLISNQLILGIVRWIWANPPLRFGFAAIDTVFYSKLKNRGIRCEDLGRSSYYWGSPTTATCMDFFNLMGGCTRIFLLCYRLKGHLSSLNPLAASSDDALYQSYHKKAKGGAS